MVRQHFRWRSTNRMELEEKKHKVQLVLIEGHGIIVRTLLATLSTLLGSCETIVELLAVANEICGFDKFKLLDCTTSFD